MAIDIEELARTGQRILPPEVAVAIFDEEARRIVGMSGAEFIARWDAGEYADIPLDETPEGRKVIGLALLIPLGRERADSSWRRTGSCSYAPAEAVHDGC